MDDVFPEENETDGNGKRSNAIPNNYSNAYENRKSKCRNDFGMARALF